MIAFMPWASRERNCPTLTCYSQVGLLLVGSCVLFLLTVCWQVFQTLRHAWTVRVIIRQHRKRGPASVPAEGVQDDGRIRSHASEWTVPNPLASTRDLTLSVTRTRHARVEQSKR